MKCFCQEEMELISINNIPYFSCKKCGYLRKNSILNKVDEKKRYDLHICDEGYKKYMHKVYDSIKKYVSGKCLDYGCGKIHLLSDILNENGYQSDYYDLYYYDHKITNKYDTIILIEVFEHILEIDRLMLDLKHLLNENGKIIIMTKKKEYPLDKFWYLRDATHVSFVDDKTMKYLAKISDLSLTLESGYYVFSKVWKI